MLGITHIVNTIAITSTPLLFNYKLDTDYALFVSACVIGALVPDIDEPSSTIGRKFPYLAYPINIFFGHRTITHNAIFAIAIIIIGYMYNYLYLSAFGLGMFIHIMQDSMTYQGVRGAFFPLQKYYYNFVLLPRIFRFAVGSKREYIVFVISCMYIIYIAYKVII